MQFSLCIVQYFPGAVQNYSKTSLIPKPVLHFTRLNTIKCKYKKVEGTRQWLLVGFINASCTVNPHFDLNISIVCFHLLKNGNTEWFIIYFSRKVAGVYFLNTVLIQYYKFIYFRKTTLFHKNRFLRVDYLHFKISSLKIVNKN